MVAYCVFIVQRMGEKVVACIKRENDSSISDNVHKLLLFLLFLASSLREKGKKTSEDVDLEELGGGETKKAGKGPPPPQKSTINEMISLRRTRGSLGSQGN